MNKIMVFRVFSLGFAFLIGTILLLLPLKARSVKDSYTGIYNNITYMQIKR